MKLKAQNDGEHGAFIGMLTEVYRQSCGMSLTKAQPLLDGFKCSLFIGCFVIHNVKSQSVFLKQSAVQGVGQCSDCLE